MPAALDRPPPHRHCSPTLIVRNSTSDKLQSCAHPVSICNHGGSVVRSIFQKMPLVPLAALTFALPFVSPLGIVVCPRLCRCIRDLAVKAESGNEEQCVCQYTRAVDIPEDVRGVLPHEGPTSFENSRIRLEHLDERSALRRLGAFRDSEYDVIPRHHIGERECHPNVLA